MYFNQLLIKNRHQGPRIEHIILSYLVGNTSVNSFSGFVLVRRKVYTLLYYNFQTLGLMKI